MAGKTDIEVLIWGKVYTLSGYESEEYMQRVALYINNKMNDLNQAESTKKLSADMLGTLMAINIADDLFKAREKLQQFEDEISEKDKQIYELKHDIIGEQIKLENADIQIEKLQEEIKELDKRLANCQSELTEYIETFGHE